jgi:hypothetical protein
MDNKLIYWIPVVGFIVCIANYEKENTMGMFWSYYQAAMVIGFISVIAIIGYYNS